MAAAARWEYRENIHYVRHQGKIYIIDQTTHKVMANPELSSESRWNGGLAQAIEAELGLRIRSDSEGSRSVTAQELMSRPEYELKTGASGTARGHGDQFAAKGLSPVVTEIPRYYTSRLREAKDVVLADEDTKLDRIAADVRDMQSAEGRNQPQLVLADSNHLVRPLHERLDALGVEHEYIDAKWFLEQGKNQDAAFEAIINEAGKPGKVLVINMQGARGVDIPVSDEAKALGGLHVRVTARSAFGSEHDPVT